MSHPYPIDLFQTYRESLFNKQHRIKKIANRKFALAKTDDLLPKFLMKDGAPSGTRSRCCAAFVWHLLHVVCKCQLIVEPVVAVATLVGSRPVENISKSWNVSRLCVSKDGWRAQQDSNLQPTD